ncbi:NAD-P-binding protein [Thelephora terrestris]|uniref:NAD-P-binding protein n=1 Tax=Thelephora terrestris TaxID=56493 RepID=A0A9P6H5F0_9AGAM|nr:NAD-P-binding protein [Thelephora terrestris]
MVFRSFAVIGAGHIGSFIVDELLRLKAAGTVSSVTVVSRSDASTSHPEWATQGAKFATIDYNDQSTLQAAFEGVEVAISAVRSTPEGLQGQKALAHAAKLSGVKIFAPSEFGTPGGSGGYVLLKKQIHEHLREIGLPYSIFYTGPCPDMLFCPFFGFDFANGKVTVPGLGDTPISFTGRPDIARYVGFVFTNLPAEKLEWKVFHVEGERTSFNAVLKSYQEKAGKALSINYIPPSELEKRTDFVSTISLRWERGEGVVGEPLDNDIYPGWNPKKVLEYIS